MYSKRLPACRWGCPFPPSPTSAGTLLHIGPRSHCVHSELWGRRSRIWHRLRNIPRFQESPRSSLHLHQLRLLRSRFYWEFRTWPKEGTETSHAKTTEWSAETTTNTAEAVCMLNQQWQLRHPMYLLPVRSLLSTTEMCGKIVIIRWAWKSTNLTRWHLY